MNQRSTPAPGAPEWDAVHHLLDATADLIEGDDFEVTVGLLTEGARCSCTVWNIHHEQAIGWVAGQAMLQLALAYLPSHWADHTAVTAIIDHLRGLPVDTQAHLARTAAAATP